VSPAPLAAYPGHRNPVLHYFGPVCSLHALVPQAGGDDTSGDFVEVSDSGLDGGCHMPLVILFPVGADVVQAVVGHHLLEQLLGMG
jgi:hypothetical protein